MSRDFWGMQRVIYMKTPFPLWLPSSLPGESLQLPAQQPNDKTGISQKDVISTASFESSCKSGKSATHADFKDVEFKTSCLILVQYTSSATLLLKTLSAKIDYLVHRKHLVVVSVQANMLLSDQIATHRIATLMVIFVQLCKHHLPQREDQVVSTVLPIS